jgi:CBS domain containing-hemolysin-like protein
MLVQLAAVPFLIALNAFFVAAEYTLVAIRPTQIGSLRDKGYKSSAKAMETLKDKPASAIGAIQVCITVTNLLLGWIGEPAMSALLGKVTGRVFKLLPEAVAERVSVTLSFAVVTLLTVVFSELLPKAVSLKYVVPFAVLTAVPILRIQQGLKPLV